MADGQHEEVNIIEIENILIGPEQEPGQPGPHHAGLANVADFQTGVKERKGTVVEIEPEPDSKESDGEIEPEPTKCCTSGIVCYALTITTVSVFVILGVTYFNLRHESSLTESTDLETNELSDTTFIEQTEVVEPVVVPFDPPTYIEYVEPTIFEPVKEEPAVEEEVAEEPEVEEEVAEEPVAEESAPEEPAVEEPDVEEQDVEEPAAEEPVAEEPAAEEPVAE